MAGLTGLGNPSPVALRNSGTPTDAILSAMKDAVEVFPVMRKSGGCDYDVYDNCVCFGIEPAYQYEDMEIVTIHRDKEQSSYERGVAWGAWGSNIARTKKIYANHKRRGKFVRFVDKWHPILFPPNPLT